MQELIELVRRDHALLHDQVGSPELGPTLEQHLAFLEAVVLPGLRRLGPLAEQEWVEARESLLEVQGAPDQAQAGAALRRHAEQMEQVVLPRLVGELDESSLSDLTSAALERHEALSLGPSDQAAMRARITDRGPDPSRPAGS